MQDLVKKHSEFISYPISLWIERTTEKEVDDDEAEDDDDPPKEDEEGKIEEVTDDEAKKDKKKKKVQILCNLLFSFSSPLLHLVYCSTLVAWHSHNHHLGFPWIMWQ